MRTIIFLDIDGVLNCDTTKDKCSGYTGIEDAKVGYLKEIVALVNGEIVLSSTWREYWEKDESEIKEKLGKYLVTKLKKQGLFVADKTPDLYWARRGQEILEWLNGQDDVDRVIILDDEYFLWEKYGLGENWICTIDGDWDMWNLNPGLMPKHIEYIKDNMEQFSYSWELIKKRQEEYQEKRNAELGY